MKILIIHASAGAGHLKAAKAVYEGLKKDPSYQVFFVDALDYTNPFFKKSYQGVYAFLVARLPWLWGGFFKILDINSLQPLIKISRRFFNSFNAKRLHDFLRKEDFHCIVTTHFLPNEIVGALKSAKKIRSRLVTVVTDFDVHRIWLNPQVDIYAAACESTKKKLQDLGVSSQKIHITGIPVAEEFTRFHDRLALKEKLGIKKDSFIVLLATGSFGFGPIEEILKALDEDFQMLVVCGYNKKLFARLNSQHYKSAKIFGLVDNMHELMAVSDVMVTKPGGLSISEALVSQLPMVFFHPIPGQETHNVRILKEYGIGCMPLNIDGIVSELKKFKFSRDAHLTALKQTQGLARPYAVRDVISCLLR